MGAPETAAIAKRVRRELVCEPGQCVRAWAMPSRRERLVTINNSLATAPLVLAAANSRIDNRGNPAVSPTRTIRAAKAC